jgi:hypothetical protein
VRKAFLARNRKTLRKLCRRGASSDLAYAEFQKMKGKMTRKNLAKWRILLASSCRRKN